jgi:hypothetical protein
MVRAWKNCERCKKRKPILQATVSVGIHALINVHEYHCIAIRMRCWLVDVLIILVEVA